MSDSDSFLYPPIEPYNSGYLEVSKIHKIYYEECGVSSGVPVVFLHGGPGGWVTGRDRRYFDPSNYRIILFDQRGSGKSTPTFCIEDNDTWKMIDDMEMLREHLGISKWIVFGGSWGSTLALFYSEKYIKRVSALVVQGVFTFRQEEIDWLYQKGCDALFPEYWHHYVSQIPENERGDLLSAYHKHLNDPDKNEALRYISGWSKWEACNTRLRVSLEKVNGALEDPEGALQGAKFGLHFFKNNGFLMKDSQILDNAKIIHDAGIPVAIVQGRYDAVAPIKTAWELHKMIPTSKFHVVEDAGHSLKEVGITKKLVEVCDYYKSIKALLLPSNK